MSKIRTKFKCMQVSNDEHGQTVGLQVQMLPTDENKSISMSTPAGEIQMRIDKKATAYGQLEPGNEYFVDFIPAEKTEMPVLEPMAEGNDNAVSPV